MKLISYLAMMSLIPIINSETVFSHRSSYAQDLHSAALHLDDRLRITLSQIRYNIPSAINSIESDIAKSNRVKAILGIANLLGSLFGIRRAIGDNKRPDFGINELSLGDQLNVLAQALYGYGYWGVFLLEMEETRLDCGTYDFDHALSEYAFLTDFSSTYETGSHLDSHILLFYATEMNHALKRALFCIISRRGSNQDAYSVNALIDLYSKITSERLSLTDEAMSTSPLQHVRKK